MASGGEQIGLAGSQQELASRLVLDREGAQRGPKGIFDPISLNAISSWRSTAASLEAQKYKLPMDGTIKEKEARMTLYRKSVSHSLSLPWFLS